MEKITGAFNLAFTNYVVPMRYSDDELRNRWAGARVDYSLSYGVVRYGKLIAFMAHGIGIRDAQRCAFNAGTGVIPSARGLHLVAHMYRRAKRDFSRQEIRTVWLEVIQTNWPALSSYYRSGFRVTRKLRCFQGELRPLVNHHPPFEVLQERYLPDFNEEEFFDTAPSWEYSREAINAMADRVTVFTVREASGQLIGMAAFLPERKLVLQFGVQRQNRNSGIGAALFRQLGKVSPFIKVNNIDEEDGATCLFLTRMGLSNYIDQYEMCLAVPSPVHERLDAHGNPQRA